jgi:hypothetical protein
MASLLRRMEAVRRLGLGWVAWRGWYELRRRGGLYKRRFPAPAWGDVTLASLLSPGGPADPDGYRALRERSAAKFFFAAGALPGAATLMAVMGDEGRRHTIAVADDACIGRLCFFSRRVFEMGRPVDWRRNPFLNVRLDSDAHWCDWTAFSPEQGDIKDVWEPSRFSCAFWLARAYALTGDEKYPRAFWEHFESWRQQNPPNRGPNWPGVSR